MSAAAARAPPSVLPPSFNYWTRFPTAETNGALLCKQSNLTVKDRRSCGSTTRGERKEGGEGFSEAESRIEISKDHQSWKIGMLICHNALLVVSRVHTLDDRSSEICVYKLICPGHAGHTPSSFHNGHAVTDIVYFGPDFTGQGHQRTTPPSIS